MGDVVWNIKKYARTHAAREGIPANKN